jgi:hypothetical protein
MATMATLPVPPGTLATLLQAAILGLLLYAVWHGDVAAAVNALGAFVLALSPMAIEWANGPVAIGPGLTLWVAAAGALHSVGMLGPYDSTWWWDHLTHTVSAALFAALAYGAALVALPTMGIPDGPAAVAGVTVALTFGVGVLWELVEVLARELGERFDIEPVLTLYGWQDTAADLVFDVVGAVLVVALDIRIFLGVARQFPDASGLVIQGGFVVLVGSVVVGLAVWLGPPAGDQAEG